MDPRVILTIGSSGVRIDLSTIPNTFTIGRFLA